MSKVQLVNFKVFLREKLRKEIGFRFCNFVSEMVENCRAEKINFVGLHQSLLMDLGQDEQHYCAMCIVGELAGEGCGCGCWR